MIKAIVFDYNGVLVRDESRTLNKIIEYLGTTKEEWRNEWFSGNRGASINQKSYQEYFLEVCSKFKDPKISKNQILEMLEERKNGYRVNSELIEIIKILRNKDYKIGLLSNYGIELRDKLKKDEIYDLFDTIVVSSEVGCQKPELEIFKILFANLGLGPEEVVFIDDASKSLENAESIGYFPILYRNNESLKIELEKILDIKL